MRDVVLDASALLAHLQGEPAGARVREALASARNAGRSLLVNMATALRRNAVVMTGDSDFRTVGSLIKISWLSAK